MVVSSRPCKSVLFSSSFVPASCKLPLHMNINRPSRQKTTFLSCKPLGSLTHKQQQPTELMHMNRLEDLTPAPSMTFPIAHSSRPTLGFPLGTALLLVVIFSLSGIFSCCYHWDRLRSILRSRHPVVVQEGQHTVISIGSPPGKATPDLKSDKVGKECGLPVIMPGDEIPKFFARPCPHETCSPEAEKSDVVVQVKCSAS